MGNWEKEEKREASGRGQEKKGRRRGEAGDGGRGEAGDGGRRESRRWVGGERGDRKCCAGWIIVCLSSGMV